LTALSAGGKYNMEQDDSCIVQGTVVRSLRRHARAGGHDEVVGQAPRRHGCSRAWFSNHRPQKPASRNR
jgi:hypothetical protein